MKRSNPLNVDYPHTMTNAQVVKAIFWACLSSWMYGYHISELNFPVNSLTCFPSANDDSGYLPNCLGLDELRYGAATAILTAGGLIGSALSDRVVRAEGISGAITWTGWLNLCGALLMAGAPHWLVLMLGRFVAGLTCGLAVCTVPPYLAALSRQTPSLTARSGQIGTLHQFAIVIGICCAQVLGPVFNSTRRAVNPEVGGIFALPRVLRRSYSSVYRTARTVTTATESLMLNLNPCPLLRPSTTSPMRTVRYHFLTLWAALTSAAETPLLNARGIVSAAKNDQLSIHDLLSTPALRTPVILVISILCLQQFSGVNAVLFYSTPVLQSVVNGASAGSLSVFITVVNAIMTIPAIVLVDKVGRRSLLLWSIACMGITSFILGYGLNHHLKRLSGFAIVADIAAFAVGFGPIPFLLISEMVPSPAIPALSSLALSGSWISTFIVAMAFLPLRNWLSTPVDPKDPLSAREGEGSVFYVFTVMLALAATVVWRGVPKNS